METIKTWDNKSTTGELMDLYHIKREGYKINNEENLSEKEFQNLRGWVLWGVQTKRCSMSLYPKGLRIWMDTDERCPREEED